MVRASGGGPPRASSPPDGDLVRRVAARDPGALEELYRRYGRPCYALARRVLGDPLLAQDVVQEVFLALWRDAAAFDADRGAFASWLLATTHHKAVDTVRREENQRKRRAGVEALAVREDPGPEVADTVWLQLRRARVLDALRVLPAEQREALGLAYFGGYTQREIAGLTGAPLGTVKTRMFAGIRRLRSLLAGSPADPVHERGTP